MQRIYRKKMLSLPSPKFVIFYNGTDKRGEVEELRLSILYNRKTDDVSLELIAVMYNINKGQNEKLRKHCLISVSLAASGGMPTNLLWKLLLCSANSARETLKSAFP